MRSSLILGVSLVLVSSASSAAPGASKQDVTLYSTRGAPLAAVAKDGAIRSAKCGPGFSVAAGNRKGDEWTRLDVWGRPAAQIRVLGSSVYDLGNCREIQTSGAPDTDDAPALYVRGARAPSSSTRAFACASERQHAALGASFRTTTGAGSVPLIFCTRDAQGKETTHGVAGGRELVVGRFEAGRWTTAHTMQRPPTDLPTPANKAFVIVAVLDMNADGAPEIVVHARGRDSYADDVYTLGRDGRVHRVVTRGGGYA